MRKKTEPMDVKLPFDDVDFLHTWAEWILYRKQRHLANYVPVGLQKTFNKLFEESGGDVKIAIKMVEQSMEKNWQGIFPVKNLNNGQQQKFDNDKLKRAIVRTANQWI
jgi:hypothetical protein